MKAVITGISGQDGAFLAKELINDGYEVFGFVRRGSLPKTPRTDSLNITEKINFHQVEITEFTNVFLALKEIKPDYIYNLAAQSFVEDSFKFPMLTNQINYDGYLNILESVRLLNLDCNIYQASTSEMFGTTDKCVLTEESIFAPRSPYAVSKLSAHNIGVNYRSAYNLNISNGILFNHESELRGREFITRKITYQLAEIKLGKRDIIKVGNLSSVRDWGYAVDYVRAMRLMTESNTNDDFVVATNKVHTVRDLINIAGNYYGFNIEFQGSGLNEIGIDTKTGKVLIKVDPKYFRPTDVTYLQGDYSKIQNALNWHPKTNFSSMIELMCCADIERAAESSFIF